MVRAPLGSGSESCTLTFTGRPATLYPTSSQKRVKPSVMSLPVWENVPVSGPKYPIRMGPCCAARPSAGRPASEAAPSATRNSRLRMDPSSDERQALTVVYVAGMWNSRKLTPCPSATRRPW